MSDFETMFTIKAESIEDYQLLLQIWKDSTEATIENTNKSNLSFGGFQCFIEDLMKDVIKVRKKLISDNKDINYQIFGKSQGDEGETILFEIEYRSFEGSAKALYVAAEDDEEKYYEYEALNLEDIPKKLKRNKFRTFQSIVEGKFLDFLIIYMNDGYNAWLEEC